MDAAHARLFWKGANALARLGNYPPFTYVCPICTKALGWKALTCDRLTKEDVPPTAVGGRVICLTCKKCNNTAGTELEKHLADHDLLEAFGRAIRGDGEVEPVTTTVELAGVEQRGEIVIEPGERVTFEGISDINPPGTAEEVRDRLNNLSKSGEWEGEKIRLTPHVGYDPWLLHVALLKAAFLAAFARLGYRYALHPMLEVVREQIQNPEKQLLPPFWGQFDDDNSGLELWHVVEPESALYVRIDRDIVFLPDPSSDSDSYERVLEDREAMWAQGKGRQLAWPTTMHMELDHQ